MFHYIKIELLFINLLPEMIRLLMKSFTHLLHITTKPTETNISSIFHHVIALYLFLTSTNFFIIAMQISQSFYDLFFHYTVDCPEKGDRLS
jgi:hypothetical protein